MRFCSQPLPYTPAITATHHVASEVWVTALALDVGAGTGRDVAWLASRSLEVVAAEPSGAMCTEATAASFAVDPMVSDSLPGLDQPHVIARAPLCL